MMFRDSMFLCESSDLCRSDVSFQCYDQTCLPLSRTCDVVPDCPGINGEDENVICSSQAPRNCLDLRLQGHTRNERYTINLGQGSKYTLLDTLLVYPQWSM